MAVRIPAAGPSGARLAWTPSSRKRIASNSAVISEICSRAAASGPVAVAWRDVVMPGRVESGDGAARGAGKRAYTFAEIGTDAELAKWADPNMTGTPNCALTLEPGDALTHGVKSPRLVGTWAMTRFLHNGSVDSLDDLLCVNGPRGDVTAPAYGNGGHTFGCDLGADDKRALLAYLKTR